MITEPVKISQSDIRRLLSAANPDAALLYLYINGGNRPEGAEADLHFSAPRYGCAAATLRQLGLWPEGPPQPHCPRRTSQLLRKGRAGRHGFRRLLPQPLRQRCSVCWGGV